MQKTNPVELHVAIALPGILARDATMHVLKAIAAATPPYDRVTLALGLRDLRIPVDADITVPVHAGVEVSPQRWEGTIEIEAANNQRLFPHFHGTVSVTPNGASASELWLQGTYDVPMGTLGETIDTTFLRGSAERTLMRFLEWLAAEVTRNAIATEREYQRETRG